MNSSSWFKPLSSVCCLAAMVICHIAGGTQTVNSFITGMMPPALAYLMMILSAYVVAGLILKIAERNITCLDSYILHNQEMSEVALCLGIQGTLWGWFYVIKSMGDNLPPGADIAVISTIFGYTVYTGEKITTQFLSLFRKNGGTK